MYVKLFKKSSTGKMRFWAIDATDNELTSSSGIIGGAVSEHTEYVECNTLRDESEQAIAKAETKIKSRVEKGWRHTIDEAEQYDGTNELGFHKPMLAQRWDRVKNIDYDNSYYQHKYDGHRCLIVNDCGEKIAYSRNGKLINTIEHILKDIDIPEGETLDGELYVHGYTLQEIASLVKRKQIDNVLLQFHCYDIVLEESFQDRLIIIQSLNLGENSHVVPDIMYTGSVKDMLNQSIIKGYEGLIVRPKIGFNYEVGKRSKGLIKVKKFFDDEFLIVDVLASRDGWAKLRCATSEGVIFGVSAPGTVPQKEMALRNKENIIGRYVRVEYANITKDGSPFHPIALGYRNIGE